ncbi:MAG: LacI family DNA-binding transcriptional regulator [Candidatus Azobacteroides sp.]|nr:LacI family DNA-binding transcriptional regulator [Candidatus Azobacteroides sp.]
MPVNDPGNRKKKASNQIIRIIDIARMAGVSPGTVDRVLHKRGRVSEEKKRKIEAVLQQLDYEPNIMARSLAKKRIYTFVSLTPSFKEGEYWEDVNEGIESAARELKTFHAVLKQFFYDQYDRKDFIRAIEDIKKEKFDGLLVATLFGEEVIEYSQELDEQEIPYIYIDANIPGQNNLAYFGADSHRSGAIAAKLLLKEINMDSDIVLVHYELKADQSSTQVSAREKGFREYLKESGFNGKVHILEYSKEGLPDNEVVEILKRKDKLTGFVVFNSRIHELVSSFQKNDLLHPNIKLIGYDTIVENVKALENGLIDYLIAQRAEMQGYNGIKALGNYLIFNKAIDKMNYMPIDILIKENIRYYNNFKY